MTYKDLKYKRPPLPFQGAKSGFLKAFCGVVGQSDADIYVDLFGGSGLLSRAVKDLKPDSRVIYNDYRGRYRRRLAMIPDTVRIIAGLKEMAAGVPPLARIPEEAEGKIKKYIQRVDLEQEADWRTLSAQLVHSAKFCTSAEEILKSGLYNRFTVAPYSTAEDYLDGLEIVDRGWKDLLEHADSWRKAGKRVFLIADPPYLATDRTQYDGYWRLSDTIATLDILNRRPFVYFTSTKSQLTELLEGLHDVFGLELPGYTTVPRTGGVADGTRFANTEQMLYHL